MDNLDVIAESLFRKQCDFVMGVAKINQLPSFDLNEVAFAGRSNVGKSSLLNALLWRRNLARTSKTPGRTQEINFFNLYQKIMLVDLPGYGYAKVSKTKSIEWNETIQLYLKGRQQLKRVFVLVDSRHGLKENDSLIMDLLDKSAVPYQIVLTKIDKILPCDYEKTIELVQQKIANRPAAHPNVIATSSEKQHGMLDLRKEIFLFT